MNNELEATIKDHESYIKQLERRVQYCEAVADQYKMMFQQLEGKLKVLADRQSNIQIVYDYLTRVGSDLVTKNPDLKRTLNPISKKLPPTDKKYLELMKSFKFKHGDEVYYAQEIPNFISYHIVYGIDIIEKHPRYILSNIFGYVDESKLFATEQEAQWQLDEWKKLACSDF